MQKKIYYVLIILVLGFLINEYPLSAQGTATGQTENEAPSKSGFERVDKVISRLVENERIIGCTALVFHDGKELFYRLCETTCFSVREAEYGAVQLVTVATKRHDDNVSKPNWIAVVLKKNSAFSVLAKERFVIELA